MADFSAVLKRTIEGLGDSSPGTRQKVYDKARQAIRAKLAASNTPLSADLAQRQIKALEDAIETVEFDFRISDAVTIAQPTPARPSPFATPRPAPSATAPTSPAVAATPASAMPRPAYSPPPHSPPPYTPPPYTPPARPASPPPRPAAAPASPVAPPLARPVPAPAPAPAATRPVAPPPPQQRKPAADEWQPEDAFDDLARSGAFDAPPPPQRILERRRGGAALALAALAFFLVAGGGAGAWLYRDQVVALFAGAPADKPADAPAAAKEAAAPADAPAGETGPTKFTQRLQEDGSEIDEGPAGGAASVGEGTSVASATQQEGPAQGSAAEPAGEGDQAPLPNPSAPADPTAPADGGGQPAVAQAPVTNAPTAPVDPTAPAIAVGQKAIFYEERTNSAEGSANPGSVVWSLVMESPGGDQPPEPAIRAEASVPERNMTVRMTIRRNGDRTLPASHIVELVLTGPENPASGAIDNVLRMTLKESEAATGNPLFGVPAKIADGFFLIALTDSKAEIEANIALMKREQWIDIPFVYGSGRRALITLEKGVPGEKAFEEALKAWEAKASG